MSALYVPKRVLDRPKDRRGLPIPFANELPDGSADFAVLQGPQSLRCARERLCGVCGQRLDYWVAFLGGPMAAKALSYVDPPMHEECAEASTLLCPHVARRKPQRSQKVAKRADVLTPANFVEEKPPGFVMTICRQWRWRITPDGALLYTPIRPHRYRFYEYDEDGVLTFDHEERRAAR